LFLSSISFNQGTTLAQAAVETTPIVEAAPAAVINALPLEELSANPKQPIVSIEQYVRTYFAKNPVMAEVARCESRFRHYTINGDILRGVAVNQDVGVMQINETYHLATAKKLGFNIYTIDGNLAYGQYLYNTQGTAPWSASAACWDR
jgi:hypothetical protein